MVNNMELTKAQQSAVDCIDENLQIIACAGSGKTEVISRRIANILKKRPETTPEQIIAFTFTEKAAESLKKRIEIAVGSSIDGMYVGTIHGFCWHLLRDHSNKYNNFKILDSVKNHLFISRYNEKCGMSALELKPCTMNNNLFLQCIDKLIDDYDNRDNWTELNRRVLDMYIECLHSHNYLDFSLLVFEAIQQIKENLYVQDYLCGIKYLIVDEYQDVNDQQEKLIHAISEFAVNICVVGDDDQTIYQFRGSNSENIISFSKRYCNVRQIRLEENFRCQNTIVDIAVKVIDNNKRRLPKQMYSGANKKPSLVSAEGYSNCEEEFSSIAGKISNLHKNGVPYNSIAILVRKGKYLVQIEEALNKMKIPCVADSAEGLFEDDCFKRFIETLRILENVDKAALYEQWCTIVDDSHFNAGFKYLRSCTRGSKYRLREILTRFCEIIVFFDDNANDIENRKTSFEGICKILDDYDEIYGDYQLSARISGLLYFLGTQATQEYKYHNFYDNEPDEAVQILTVHKSKGLEFNTVFLPRLNKNEFPVFVAGGKRYYHVLGGSFTENKYKYESDEEDERKLFYVAITRAEQNLFMSYTLENQPVSEFVKEASKSDYLQINKNDLNYQPLGKKVIKDEPSIIRTEDYKSKNTGSDTKNNDYEIREAVRIARNLLYDEYCVANHFCKGIISEYTKICQEGPQAILNKAREMNLI